MYILREAFSFPLLIVIFLHPSLFHIQVAKNSLSSHFRYMVEVKDLFKCSVDNENLTCRSKI